MLDLNQTIEGLFRLFVLMLPVMGVLLLFVAAHLVGGALKSRGRHSEQKSASVPSQRPATRVDRDVDLTSKHEPRVPAPKARRSAPIGTPHSLEKP